MLTRILRIAVVAAIAVALALAVGLTYLGVPAWLAVIIAATVPFLFHAIPLAIEFITGAIGDRRPIARLSVRDAVRVWLVESWRSFSAFSIDQPWRADFPERPIAHDAQRPAVLLVHGYLCNRGVWRPWLLGGLPTRWNIATISLEPVYGSIESYAAALHEAVERLRRVSGAPKVTLICHSMGGLAARTYLRAYGAAWIDRVITIDTPHQGTLFARFSHGINTRQMRRASDYVRQLATCDEPVEFICFASQDDNLIVPRASQVLECAEAIWFEKAGHLAMTTNHRVLAKLIEVIERPRRRTPDRSLEMNAAH